MKKEAGTEGGRDGETNGQKGERERRGLLRT